MCFLKSSVICFNIRFQPSSLRIKATIVIISNRISAFSQNVLGGFFTSLSVLDFFCCFVWFFLFDFSSLFAILWLLFVNLMKSISYLAFCSTVLNKTSCHSLSYKVQFRCGSLVNLVLCYVRIRTRVWAFLLSLRYRFMVMDRLGSDLQKACESSGGRLKKTTVLQLGQRLVR